jgi:MFS family permease
VLHDGQLLRLDFGIFALHAAQMAMFVVIPFALRETGGLPEAQHWKIYLPVMLGAFVFMVPAIIYSEKKAKHKPVFVFAVALLLLSQLLMTALIQSFWGIVAMLLLFFIAFNILEASLPSLISRLAPARSKGTAMGVYNTSQSLGLFAGGVAGGLLSHYAGQWSVFAFGGAISALWLVLAASMKTPPAVRTRMFHIEPMSAEAARELSRRLIGLEGVMEAIVDPEEGAAYLKVEMAGWDEDGVTKLIEGGA